MWISRQVYQDIVDARLKAEAAHAALAQHLRAYETTLDWFRVRMTQLEHERAILLKTYMGITVPVPEFVKQSPKDAESPYHNTPHFNDIGDAEAAALGIGWNEDGTLKYAADELTAK